MQRHSDTLLEIKDVLEEFGKKNAIFRKDITDQIGTIGKELESQRERIEELEVRGRHPGKTPDAKSQKVTKWRVYETSAGPIYELPSDVKMTEVLPPKEQPEISLTRWLPAALIGERCEDKAAVQFAREKKQITTGTSGVLIPQEYQSEWIDLIRSQMALLAAGMTTVTMEAKTLNASAIASDPAATWHSEAGAISADDPTFAARTLTAQTLVTRCQASVEVSQDSPDFGAQLARVMARAMAVELDRVGLVGSGTPPEPKGILNTSGRKQVTAVGTISDYSKLLLGVRRLLESNLPLEVAAANAIMSPSSWAALEGLATGITNDKTQLPRPRALEAMRYLVTTNGLDVGSPLTSTIFLGDFRDLVLGVRAEASVEALKLTTYASNLQLEFVGYLRADYMLRRPASFCTLEGVAVS